MGQTERETAIDSLNHLQGYYQSKYKYYLAMATEAKEHRERVSLLLQDLLGDECDEENYLIKTNTSQEEQHNGKAQPLLVKGNLESTNNLVADENSSALDKTEQMKRLINSLSRAMLIIESISNKDLGKTLHKSYLHKILNLELKEKLGIDFVELYLESAITTGYLKLDEFDSSCYTTVKKNDGISEATVNQNGNAAVKIASLLEKNGKYKASNSIQESRLGRDKRSSSPKFHNLPPSNTLKPTLLETINQYLVLCRPKRFSIEDIVNYLYSPEQQLNWSLGMSNKVRKSISNVLSRKAYLGKYWKRIKLGTYQPL